MKQRPWRKILFTVSGLLLFVGLAPLAYFVWWGLAHDLEPLSMPIPPKPGEYASPFFTTDLDDDHQVEIWWLRSGRTPLDLDWKIVDEAGAPIRSGRFHEDQLGGNTVALDRSYRPKPGSRHRVVLNIHHDIEAPIGDTSLYIGVPDRGLQRAYGSILFIGWAALVGGAGVILLMALALWRYFRPIKAVLV